MAQHSWSSSNISYLWTYDLYGPIRNAFDMGISIMRSSERGLGQSEFIHIPYRIQITEYRIQKTAAAKLLTPNAVKTTGTLIVNNSSTDFYLNCRTLHLTQQNNIDLVPRQFLCNANKYQEFKIIIINKLWFLDCPVLFACKTANNQKEWHIAAKPSTQELDKKGYVDANIQCYSINIMFYTVHRYVCI